MSVVQRTTSTIDADGNVQKMEVTIINRLPKEPDFIKLYSNNIHLLDGIYEKDRNILDRLIAGMGYDGMLHLTPSLKKQICFELELFQMDGKGSGHALKRDSNDNPIPSLGGFNSAVVRLQKRMILLRMGQSTYMVNPFLYAKGLWSEVKKLQAKVSHLFNISEEDKV